MKIKTLTKQEYNQFRKENKENRISAGFYRHNTPRLIWNTGTIKEDNVITSIESYYIINGQYLRLSKMSYLPGINMFIRRRYQLVNYDES